MFVLILYLLAIVIVYAVGRILFMTIHKIRIQKQYDQVMEHAAGKDHAPKQEQPQETQTGISREQLENLYHSGLISRKEYKARLKKQ